jgi:hypothetical protein
MSFERVTITPEIPGANAPVVPPATPPATPPADPAKKETPGTPPPSTPERPKWLPEKFKSAEDMATAYAELEKKQSAPPATPPATPEVDPATGKPKEAPVVPPAQPQGNEQFQPFFDEFAKDGKLSDASMEALEKKGFSKAVVEQFIAGGQARQAQYESNVMEAAGGKEAYKAMTDWAAKNLTEGEISTLNATLESGNVEAAKLAVSGLHARHLEAVGRPPSLVRGNGGEALLPFKSSSEVTRAMNDPRYRTDEAYRQEVAQRLSASSAI